MGSKKLKAVIFDMDGLMIDSEHLHSRSLEIVLNKYGVEPKLNEYGIIQTLGIGVPSNWERLKKKYNLNSSVERLTKEKHRAYENLIPKIKPMEGLRPLLRSLQKSKIKMAVASGESMKNIKTILNQINVDNYFGAFVSGEEVNRPKPAPDIFLEAAKQLKTEPEFCIVMEDAKSGIEAAKKADMKAVVVLTDFNYRNNFENADKIYKTLVEIKVSELKELLR